MSTVQGVIDQEPLKGVPVPSTAVIVMNLILHRCCCLKRWHIIHVAEYDFKPSLAVQIAVDLSLISEVNPTFDPRTVMTRLRKYPIPPHIEYYANYFTKFLFPFLILLSFIIITATICQEIAQEKENKFKVGYKAFVRDHLLLHLRDNESHSYIYRDPEFPLKSPSPNSAPGNLPRKSLSLWKFLSGHFPPCVRKVAHNVPMQACMYVHVVM